MAALATGLGSDHTTPSEASWLHPRHCFDATSAGTWRHGLGLTRSWG